MAELFHLPTTRVIDQNGIADGATLTFYLSGTTTPTPVYTTEARDVEHPNPLTVESGAAVPSIYLSSDIAYRCIVKNAAGTTIDDIDPYQGLSSLGVLFTQSGTGAVGRTAQAKLRETVSVSDFMGVLTVTAAFQAALDTGKHVYVPSGTYALTGPVLSNASGQRIYGDGGTSIITQSGADADANAVQIIHDDCIVEGLNITPGTTVTSLAEGWAIQVTGDRCIVRNNRVSGSRRGGVHLSNSNYNIVEGNVFTDSVVTQNPLDPEPQSDMGYDVYLDGTSSYNIIRGNQCISGCGVGIGCQTAVESSEQFGNLIDGNICKNHPCYGIMLYGSFELPEINTPVHDCVISNNIVEDISGIVYIDGASWFYGAGIYIASARKFVCIGNRVKSTNTDTSLPHTSGTPAAISSTGYGDGIISNNVIEDCYDGVWLTQGNTSTASDVCLILNNAMTNVRRHGVHLSNAIAAKVTGNRIVGSGMVNRGILINDTIAVGDRFDLSDNYVSGFNVGIEVIATNPFVRATGNILRNCVNYGIYSTAPRIHIAGNDISMNAGQTAAILYTSAALSGICRDNTMIADTTGLVAQSTAVQNSGNILNGTLLYTGSLVWNPGSLADGAGETSSAITVTGAALGDFVAVSAPYDLQGITASAYVSAADAVKVRIQNESGGVIDLASGTWKVRVQKAA